MRLDLAPTHPFPFSLLLPLGSSEVVAVLARVLRSLGAVLLVALTSFSLVATSVPAYAVVDPAPGGAARTIGKAAGAVGTRAAPLRLITCGSLVGLIGCSAAAGGMYWLSQTDSGREFGGDALDFFGFDGDIWRGDARAMSNSDYCHTLTEPTAWSNNQVSMSLDFVGDYSGWGHSCWSAHLADHYYAGSAAAIVATCVTPSGTLYNSTAYYTHDSDGLFTFCINTGDWLIGVRTGNGGSTRYKIGNPAYYKNPTWNGIPGANPDWWNDNVAQPKTTATITCRNADGSQYTKSVTVQGATSDPVLTCDPGGTVVGRKSVIQAWGDLARTLYDVKVSPEALAEYPQCFSGGSYCDLGVTIDGILCEYGRSNCADWWDFAQQNPQRVGCVFGPYTLGYGDCRELHNAYVTPDGAWSPPDLPPTAAPIPYYPTNPDYRPDPPPVGSGADPGWIDPAQCPPAPASFFAYGTSEYGLQPIAVQGLRCFALDHPDFMLTSGHRSSDHSAWYSDHPHGLALDLAPPNWSTPAGNQRGWDAVAYWIWNYEALGVRYVIFDSAIWWPETGWHVYTGPSPHEDHVHVSLDPYAPPSTSAPSPSPTVPYPQPTPSPDPAPPTNPAPPTAPPGTDPPGGGGGGLPDPDGPNCDGSAVTWNPVSWVLVPLRCAFVPSTDVSELLADKAGALTDTSVGAWLAAPIEVGNAVSAAGGAGPVVALGGSETFSTLSDGDSSPSSGGPLFPRLRSGLDGGGGGAGTLAVARDGLAAGESFGTQSFSTLATCQGPAMTVDLGFVGAGSTTIHPIAACDGPMAAISTIVRVGLAVLINATVLIAIPEMLLSVMGFKRTVTSASIAAGWKEDTV